MFVYQGLYWFVDLTAVGMLLIYLPKKMQIFELIWRYFEQF